MRLIPNIFTNKGLVGKVALNGLKQLLILEVIGELPKLSEPAVGDLLGKDALLIRERVHILLVPRK